MSTTAEDRGPRGTVDTASDYGPFRFGFIKEIQKKSQRREARVQRKESEGKPSRNLWKVPPPIDFKKPRHSLPRVILDANRPYPRLPSSLKPVSYHLLLLPVLELFTFSGKVLIVIKVIKRTSKLVLNSFGLEIESVKLFDSEKDALEAFTNPPPPSEKNQLSPSSYSANDAGETLEISMESFDFRKSTLAVIIEYTGSINNEYSGFCTSKFICNGIEEGFVYIGMAHPFHARRIFPCFDEPIYPAVFRISICVPKRMTVLCNSPVGTIIRGPLKNYKEVIFKETPPISPSSVGFVIGNLQNLHQNVDGIPVAVHCVPQIPKRCLSNALKFARMAVQWFKALGNNLIEPAKLDIVAVEELSREYQAGATIAVCLDSSMLYDDAPNESGSRESTMYKISSAIANIVATQWFQHVLPQIWWSDCWAYFGTIKYAETAIVESILGKLEDAHTNLRIHVFNKIMRLDCLDVVHPVKIEYRDPPQIEEILDNVALKSAAVMRMWSGLSRVQSIAPSIKYLLNRPAELFLNKVWVAIGSPNPVFHVETYADFWKELPGYPVVTFVSGSIHKGVNRCTFVVTQERFRSCIEDTSIADSTLTWPIVLIISTSASPKRYVHKQIGKLAKVEVTIPVADFSWINLNAGGTGYFRTRYPLEMLRRLMKYVRNSAITPVDRIVLLDDTFELALSGYYSMVEVLHLLASFQNEENAIVWTEIDKVVERLDFLLTYASESVYKAFQEAVLRLYAKIEAKYGKNTFNELVTGMRTQARVQNAITKICPCLLRREKLSMGTIDDQRKSRMYNLILRRFLLFGHKETVEWAKEKYVMIANNELDAIADFYGTLLLGFAVSEPNEETLHLVMRAYRKATRLESKDIVIDAFIPFTNTPLVKNVLHFALSPGTPINHTVEFMARCGATKAGRFACWQFFKDNVAYFHRQFYKNEQLLRPFFLNVLSNFVTRDMFDEIRTFFQAHTFQGLQSTIQLTLDSIRRNYMWVTRDFKSTSVYIDANKFVPLNPKESIADPSIQGIASD